MSRFRRLKEEKIKNKIKAISCALALALVIGSVQGLGTYALFTDTEDIESNLAISTGDVDVKVSQGQTITSIGEEIVFEITNEGTLNQNISLKIEAHEELSKELGQVGIYFDNNAGISSIEKITLDEYIDLKNGKTLFVLSPGQTIKGFLDLDIHDSIEENKEYKLNLIVKARQINELGKLPNNSDGFYDEETQKNTVNINTTASIILEDYTGSLEIYKPLFSDKYKININHNVDGRYKGIIESIDDLNGTLDANKGKIISVTRSGVFNNTECTLGDKQIEIKGLSKDFYNLIGSSYGIGNHINLKFEYEDGHSEYYRVDFRKDRLLIIFNSIEAKVTKISAQEFASGTSPLQDVQELDESNIVESPKEETKAPNDVEVVEPTTEEIEAPSEEVMEPTTEEIEAPSEEVMEPTIEEVEAPSEEIVEPTTEEIEAPSEEVMEPTIEEVEAPSEEIVEPTTEEIEIPSEEVVEPSTGEIEVPSEVVVEPSTGEIEVPSEVVEPKTEEIEAPSEINVVLPSKEETEIEG